MLRKLTLLSLLLITIPTALGMEVGCYQEGKREAEEVSETKLPTKPIILISSEGDEFQVAPHIVEFSEAIKAFWEDFKSLETEREAIKIDVPAKGNAIALLVNLINQIQRAIEDQADEKGLSLDSLIKAPNGHIIAKNLQKIVNEHLANKSIEKIDKLIRLADFLCMPALCNAAVSVYLSEFQKNNKEICDTSDLKLWLSEWYFPESVNELLIKHWYLQQANIDEEWSIRDLMTTVRRNLKVRSGSVVRLSHKSLTSLDGLYDIPDIDRAGLWIELDHNNLTRLPVGIFQKLNSPSQLYLSHNELVELPEDFFNGLASLSTVDLSNNNLRALPITVFDNCPALDFLFVSNNRLTEENKIEIFTAKKEKVPACSIVGFENQRN